MALAIWTKNSLGIEKLIKIQERTNMSLTKKVARGSYTQLRGGMKADILIDNYLFHICALSHCFRNIYCHALHFLSESEGDRMHCSWCVFYRVL